MAKAIKEALELRELDDLKSKEVSASSPKLPNLTKGKVNAALDLLRDLVANGGLLRISREVGLHSSQVKEIYRAMQARIGELSKEK
jgi:hypothetical protein